MPLYRPRAPRHLLLYAETAAWRRRVERARRARARLGRERRLLSLFTLTWAVLALSWLRGDQWSVTRALTFGGLGFLAWGEWRAHLARSRRTRRRIARLEARARRARPGAGGPRTP